VNDPAKAVSSRFAVADASVGVKWFVSEPGREDAIELLRSVASGEITLVVPDLFVYEVLRTIRRKAGDAPARAAVAFFSAAGIVTVPPVEHVLEAALDAANTLGCDFYDACAPAIATALLGRQTRALGVRERSTDRVREFASAPHHP
jgi:predicted nucleic acid-binding protein